MPTNTVYLDRLYVLGKCTEGSLRESTAMLVGKRGRRIQLKSRKLTRPASSPTTGFRVDNAIDNVCLGKRSESKIIIIYIMLFRLYYIRKYIYSERYCARVLD